MFWRIAADIALFLAIFFSPWWWFAAILAVIFISIFPRFWEAVAAGIIIDVLFGGWYFTAGFLVALFIIEKFKKQLF
jgi:hypothetical protein